MEALPSPRYTLQVVRRGKFANIGYDKFNTAKAEFHRFLSVYEGNSDVTTVSFLKNLTMAEALKQAGPVKARVELLAQAGRLTNFKVDHVKLHTTVYRGYGKLTNGEMTVAQMLAIPREVK